MATIVVMVISLAYPAWLLSHLTASPYNTVSYDNRALGVRPLQLYKPGTYFCPMILSGISSYIFAPGSDFVDIVGSCSPNPCLRMNVQDQGRFAGSWSELIPPLPSLSIFNQFSPGVYTVAGGDEWGDLLVLNFTVS